MWSDPLPERVLTQLWLSLFVADTSGYHVALAAQVPGADPEWRERGYCQSVV